MRVSFQENRTFEKSEIACVLLPCFDKVSKTGELRLERQFDSADGAVTLLADDDLGLAMQALHVLDPFFHGRQIFFTRLFTLFLVFAAIDEHHHVGVLFN